MEYEYLELKPGEYVKILKYLNEKDSFQQTAILIIPGNPGLIEYYEQFALYLGEHTELPILGISHTGHLNGNNYGFNSWRPADLHQQINDKIHYIQKHLKENHSNITNLILIGHSIGCHIVLHVASELEKQNSNIKIVKSICLFPTVERMALTPQGRLVTPLLEYFLWLYLLIAFIITKLPLVIIDRATRWSFGRRKTNPDIDEKSINTSIKMVSSYHCLKSIAVMAKHEMRLVKAFNHDLLEGRIHDTMFYYGTKDHWCPLDYYKDMKNKLVELYPDYKHHSCLLVDDNQCDHAFVISLKQTEYISKKVSKWISNEFM
jgi:pimeloyl-ACP methyl ester carboxylesterase